MTNPPYFGENRSRLFGKDLSDYYQRTRDLCLVEGFHQVLAAEGVEEFGPTPAHCAWQTAVSHLLRMTRLSDGGKPRLVFRPAPLPGDPTASNVVFVFSLGMGMGSALPQPSGQFDLALNDEPLVSFCFTKSSRIWAGARGARLLYDVKRVHAAPKWHVLNLGPCMSEEHAASFGAGLLSIPRAALPVGEITFALSYTSMNESRRWVRLDRWAFGAGAMVEIDIDSSLDLLEHGLPRHTIDNDKVWFGDIHTHSGAPSRGDPHKIACGSGSLDENYLYARDIARLDLYALTDHEFQLIEPADWDQRLDACGRYHRDGQFVCLNAFEWTSQLYGHRNVYYGGAEGRMIPGRNHPQAFTRDNPSIDGLWAQLDQQGLPAITVPHHPAAMMHATNWEHWNPKYDRLVEIYSQWGSSERRDDPLQTDATDLYPAGTVRAALARGLHFGLIASSDGHDGHPGEGQGMTHKHAHIYHFLGSGRIGVIAPELTRAAIFDAMYRRRTYATTGEPMLVDFRVGGAPQGSEVRRRKRLVATARVLGTTPIREMQLIVDGRVRARCAGEQRQEEWEVVLPSDPAPSHCYLKVVQEDYETAWSSPVRFI